MSVPATGALLGLEASGRRGSVALDTGEGTPAVRHLPDRRGHGARILPAVRDLLDAAGLAPAQLAGVAVGAGPGSFTGVRVAVAAGLGLSRAAGVPLLAVSSLAAAALPALTTGTPPSAAGSLLVCFDARGERLFVAGYRWRDGDLQVTLPPRFARLEEVVGGELSLPAGTRCAGPGARRHAASLAGAGFEVAPEPAGDPDAAGVLLVVRTAPALARLWRDGMEPDYLRASSAERDG